jgi:2-hydroxychromene-2-carboxylate isomerase
MYETRANPVPAKQAYTAKDLQDWARVAGLKIKMPPTVFPVNAVKSMRGCIWADTQDALLPFATATFEAYWSDDQDISQDAVLTKICERVGLDPAAFFAGIGEQGIKDALKANTDEAIARGAFGSPTIYLDKTDMYFGNDRLPLVFDALARKNSAADAVIARI